MLDLKYNFNSGSNNGNPISITNNRVTGRSQTFTYDQLNRISTAKTSATYASNPAICWGQAFGYDSSGNWGNLLSIAGASSAYTGCTQGSLSVTVTTKNQISGDTYDAAGNLWIIPGTGGATYLYNAENQLTSTSNSGTTYVYDGDGNRVMKSGSKIYWYAGSEVLDETDTTGSVTNGIFNEYIFFGGGRIARRDSSNNVFYYLVDQLGSSRVIVQGGQTSFCYDGDFEPFGGEHTYTNTCPQNYKFTGKERDSESNLDNFGARYYASTTGRFMSPDWSLRPIAVPYAHFGDPQTLNLYTYVQNSPLNRIDADGHGLCAGDNRCNAPHLGGSMDEGDLHPIDYEADAAAQARQQAQNTSKKCGFFCGLGQRFSNVFSGKGFHTNEQLLPKGTVTTTETYWVHEPNPYVTAATDVAGLVAPVSGKAGKVLGPVTSVVSLANDRSPTNVVLNVVPLVFEESAFPLAFLGAYVDLANAGAQHLLGGWEESIEKSPRDPTLPAGVVVMGVRPEDF